MCSQNTFLVTCSVVCNVSFPSQIAFPSSWWVSVFLFFFCFGASSVLCLLLLPYLFLLVAVVFFQKNFCPALTIDQCWTKILLKKQHFYTEEKRSKKAKNTQKIEKAAYYDGAGEHPKAGKQKRKANQIQIFSFIFQL